VIASHSAGKTALAAPGCHVLLTQARLRAFLSIPGTPALTPPLTAGNALAIAVQGLTPYFTQSRKVAKEMIQKRSFLGVLGVLSASGREASSLAVRPCEISF